MDRSYLAWLPKPAARWSRLFALGALVGVFGGLAAAAMEAGLHHGTHRLIDQVENLGGGTIFTFRWELLVLPAIGGLLSGLVVFRIFKLRPGHGTDILIRAFHHNMGDLSPKGPIIKGVAAVGVISCGGCTGPEGPIAAIGASLGSAIGKLFRLTPRERRILLIAGCGAGIGAIFRCPLGGALFATGILYSEPEFESDAIVPSFVASVLGYSTYMLFWGAGAYMLPNAVSLRFSAPIELIPYAILGPLCGIVSILFYYMHRTVERVLLPVSRLPRWLAPAFGGLATGALACILPQVMDGQYDFISNAVNGRALWEQHPNWTPWNWAAFFGCVALFKCLGNAFTVGSGASGGIIGPAVFIGGALGATLGMVCEALFPGQVPEPLRQALIPVGMAGFLSAGMRTPLAAIVMVTEMTGSYGLIVPLMLVCVSAYVIGRRWGLSHEQLPTPAESPAHGSDAILRLLEAHKVGHVMDRNWAMTASPESSVRELIARLTPGTRPVFAVTRGERIVGVISVPDIKSILDHPVMADTVIAADIMTERLETAAPDEDLYEALSRFLRTAHDVLPVVSRDRKRRWLGMLTREQVFDTVRGEIEKMQRIVMREHAGLAAFGQEAQLQQLVLGVAPLAKDRIQRLLVPLQAVGQSIRQADFRREFGATIIAVELPDGTVQSPPDIDAPLTTGMRLLAIVTP